MSHPPDGGEEELLDTGCLVCGKDDNHDRMLLCDSCVGEYHTYCLKPKLEKIPKCKWFCDVCKGANEKGTTELDVLVAALPSEHKARFGEICWAQGGVGYGWWPCCIFDPRWARGKPLEEAKRQLGKRYLVYFYMCTDSPFALLPENKTMAWLDGLACNYFQGRAAKNYSRERFSVFQQALLVATTEFDKSVTERHKSLNLSRKNSKSPEPTRPTLSPRKILSEPISTTCNSKRKRGSGDESFSKGSFSQGPIGAKNVFPQSTLNGKVMISAHRNNHDSTSAISHEDSELICTVWEVSDADHVSSGTQVGFVILASKASSTFQDVRKSISLEIDALSRSTWRFCVPPLGPVSLAQERLFGPMLPFYTKHKLAGDTMMGDGTIHHPLRIHVIVEGKTHSE